MGTTADYGGDPDIDYSVVNNTVMPKYTKPKTKRKKRPKPAQSKRKK